MNILSLSTYIVLSVAVGENKNFTLLYFKDSGWPVFKGKHVEYPKFKKEWWDNRRTCHSHVRASCVAPSRTSAYPPVSRP
jgi:hypothetical protein